MVSSASYPREYAPYHGLATDGYALNPDLSAIFNIPQVDQHPGSSLSPPIPLPREEKLRLKKSELLLLTTSIQKPPLPSWDEILPDLYRIRNLKLEVPLIADEKALTQPFPKSRGLNLENLGIFKDCTDGPTEFLDLAAEWHAKLSNEKLYVSKEDLMYLQGALQNPCSAEEYEQVLTAALPSYTSVSIEVAPTQSIRH
jgi:hypothetical protein